MVRKKYKLELNGYKSSYLFSNEEMFCRENVSQSEFEELFRPFASSVVNAIENAMTKFKVLRTEHPKGEKSRNFKATTLNSFITEELMNEPLLEWGEITGRKQRVFIKVGKYRLFVKKVDKKLRPANLKTKTVEMYDAQMSEDNEDKIPVLYLGYQLDVNWNNIVDVSIVCRKGDLIEWFLDLSTIIEINEVHRLNVENGMNAEVEVTVKPKQDSGRKIA